MKTHATRYLIQNQSAETGHKAISLDDASPPCRWWWDLSQVDEQNIR